MFSRRFWVDAAERAVKTAAQAAASLVVADQAVGLLDVDWAAIAGLAAMAAAASLLTSVASSRVGSSDTASLAGE